MNKNKGSCKNKGFTLIELLVVVLIIGILAGIALPQYKKIVKKTEATEALILIKSLAEAQEIYFLTHNKYSDKLDELDISLPEWWTTTVPSGIDVSTYSSYLSNNKWLILWTGKNRYGWRCLGAASVKDRGKYSFWWCVDKDPVHKWFPLKKVVCNEKKEVSAGSFCVKIFNGSYLGYNGYQVYSLP